MKPGYKVVPVEWSIVYPAHVEPIGLIKREGRFFHAWLEQEDLGTFDSGDAASVAIWERFLEFSSARHEHASRTHGGYDRHR